MQTKNPQLKERSPIVSVMGHIDHGKSTLLSYIRQSKKPLNEAGGITQHISAYEVEHESKDGKKHNITFLDTPGHEAFWGIRKRGAKVADIAVLVVSAEDGVKPQTLEAVNLLRESNTPFVVAINKIDKPSANIEKTKQNLAENGIYIENWGGDIPAVAISAKTGEGIPDLFEIIILMSELQDLKGDENKNAEGMILESNKDPRKGVSATCIIKDGVIEKGMYVVSGISIAPVRMMENYLGKPISKAVFGSPVKIIGWDTLPEIGKVFVACTDRDEAKELVEKEKNKIVDKKSEEKNDSQNFLPLIIKADTGSSLEAILNEIKKLGNEKIKAKIISSGIGSISESDVRLSEGSERATVVGFNVEIDSPAKNLAERNETEIKNFDIIYKLKEWLEETLEKKTPKTKMEESLGIAKILKIFSKVKDKQVLGGRVEKGVITKGSMVKILRRDEKIGEGKIKELQQMKVSVNETKEGSEFGAMIEAKIEIAPGDKIENFVIVEK